MGVALIEGLTGRQFASVLRWPTTARFGWGEPDQELARSPILRYPQARASPSRSAMTTTGQWLAAANDQRAVEGVSRVSELAGRLSSMVLAPTLVRAALTTPRTSFNTRVTSIDGYGASAETAALKAVAYAIDWYRQRRDPGVCRRGLADATLQELGDLPTNTLTAWCRRLLI